MKKYVFGFMAILAGALLLGFNLDYLDDAYFRIVFSWQMLLIAIGVINLFDRKSLIAGFILISIGTFFLAPKLWFFPFDFVKVFWPALLIMGGVLIIMNRMFVKRWKDRINQRSSDTKVSDIGFIDETNIFSGGKRIITGDLKGGKITNIFGGIELDLTEAYMTEDSAVLDITCIFGGATLFVPNDWNVKIDMSSVLGGFSDKRKGPTREESQNSKTLIVRGSAILGGGEIKR